MNDEYLWQKTGADREISTLEESLAVFRYREDAPPTLPVRQSQKRPDLRFSFGFAFAAVSFAAVVVAANVWYRIQSNGGVEEMTFVSTPAAETFEPAPAEHGSAPSRQPESPRRPARKAAPKNYRLAASAVVRHKAKGAETTALTKEERYAYERLMLALAISSSRLKMVQNAVDGVDDADNSPRQNNR